MTTDGTVSVFKTAKKGDAWLIDGPCIVRVASGSCRLEFESDASLTVKDLDMQNVPGYDDDDKQPTATV